MIRFKRNKNYNKIFLIIIAILSSCCAFSVLFPFLALNKIPISNLDISNINFQEKEQEIEEETIDSLTNDDSILNRVKRMIIFGFSSFLKYCPESDELRPNTNQCIQNFGFQSSFYESLETLYLLNLTKSFNIAKNRILKNDQFNFKNEYLIRSELFNRVVASLIGTFLVTKQQLFLETAENLVDSIFSIDSKSFFPYPVLNFNLQRGFERSWENGTSITDIVSGLPEILSLYKITNKEKYLQYVKNLLEKLKKSNSNLDGFQKFIFYDNENGKNKTSDFLESSNSGNFDQLFESLLKSYFLIDLAEIKEMIPASIFSGSYYNSLFFDSYHFMHSSPDVNFNVKTVFNERFEFDALLARNKIRQISQSGKSFFESGVIDFVDQLLNYTESKCRSSFGYSGISFSNSKKQRLNNIQHSSFFGNWGNCIAQALQMNTSFWNHSLFNTRGHLLYM